MRPRLTRPSQFGRSCRIVPEVIASSALSPPARRPVAFSTGTGGFMTKDVSRADGVGPVGGVSLASYLDSSGPRRRARRRRADDPGRDAQGDVPRLDQAGRQQPARCKVLLLHGGPGVTARVLRGLRQLAPGGRHRVLLLRPARLLLQRPARRPGPVGDRRASSTRSSRSARRSGSTTRTSSCSGQSWGGILAIEYALKYQEHLQGARRLEHDGEHPGLQRLRRGRADAGDGPGGARRDQAARGRGEPRATRATWSCSSRTTTSTTSCGCPPPSGPIR